MSTGCEAPRQAVTATIINDAPACPANSAVCINAAPFALTVHTIGGVYSGNGVTNGVFSPAAAGVGTHTITYTLVGKTARSPSPSMRCRLPQFGPAETSGAVPNDGHHLHRRERDARCHGGGTYLWSDNSTSGAITVAPPATTSLQRYCHHKRLRGHGLLHGRGRQFPHSGHVARPLAPSAPAPSVTLTAWAAAPTWTS